MGKWPRLVDRSLEPRFVVDVRFGWDADAGDYFVVGMFEIVI